MSNKYLIVFKDGEEQTIDCRNLDADDIHIFLSNSYDDDIVMVINSSEVRYVVDVSTHRVIKKKNG